MNTRQGKGYTTQSINKRERPSQEPHLMLKAPKGSPICRQCHAIFDKKRWHFDEAKYTELAKTDTTEKVLCPACQKIRDEHPDGIVTLKWRVLHDHVEDIVGMMKNAEARAMSVNPLERIMKVVVSKNEMEVQTTSDRFAQRLGKDLVKAFQGEVVYHWGHRDKLVRVEWHGPSPAGTIRKRTAE